MLSPLRKLSSRNLAGPVQSSIFFILFFLYLCFNVDMHLIYHGGGVITNFPAFYKGWDFFWKFTSYPGGLVEYASAFLSQLFYIGWAGALVVTLQAWLLCVCTDAIIKTIGSTSLRPLRFVPPILLLIIYSQYAYHFATTMALLTALLFACLYLKIARSKIPNYTRLVTFLALSVILYYIAGAAYLLFALLCAIFELLFRRRRGLGLMFLVSAAVIPYVLGARLFGVSIVNAFSDLLPFSWKIIGYKTRKQMVEIVYILYLLVPSTALAFWLWQMLKKKIPLGLRINLRKRKTKSKKQKTRNTKTSLSAAFRWASKSLVVVIIIAAVFFSYDSKQKKLLAVDYYACHKMWPELLTAARHHLNDPRVIQAVNRALYHTGRLGYEMFSYPQYPDAFLLTEKKFEPAYWNRFDTHIELGLVNLAQKDLTECMEIFGKRPLILKRLALVNMVKGNIGSARIYLETLRKTLFHADWANHYLALLQTNPDLSTDKCVQNLRSLMMEKDYATIFLTKEKTLSLLLEKNSQNRMAFEYLMACYLLNKQLDKLDQNIKRLSDFNYPELPRHYEEAALIYTYATKKPVNLSGYQANPLLRQNIKDFSRTYNSYKENKAAAFYELARDYGDSYFLYLLYGGSGINK